MHNVRISGLVALLLCSLVISLPQAAFGQGFDLQQFNPTPNLEGDFLQTQSGEVAPHLGLSGFALFNYANDPLVREEVDGERLESIVEHQGTTHLMFSIGLFDRFELGLDIPIVVFQEGQGSLQSMNPGNAGVGVGDIRLVPKAQLWSNRAEAGDRGMALALLVDSYLPSGDATVLQGGDFRIGPRVAFDYDFGGPRVAANLGYLYRDVQELENLEVRDTLSWSVGGEVPVHEAVSVSADIFGRVSPAAAEISVTNLPLEALLGAKVALGDFRVVAGGGAGLLNGYGTPDFRAFFGLGWAPRVQPEPIAEPEPELECRMATVVEDCLDVPSPSCEGRMLRSYMTVCGDGECSYPVTETRCAMGTICGEEDGEPACVPAPSCEEDADCDDPPRPICEDDLLTTYSGLCGAEGCEYASTETTCEEGYECGLSSGMPACVEVTDLVVVDEEAQRIEILEVVFFETNSDEIGVRSYRLLNQVAQALENNPQLGKIRIEGHTDSRGSRELNRDLSQRRADSVRNYLIERGIDAERLDTQGFGPDRPLEDNSTEDGRSINRRVEFHIVE